MIAGVIYTAVSDGYDSNPLQVKPEDGVQVELRRAPAGVDPVKWNREQKIMLPPTDGLWSLYLDGSFSTKVAMKSVVEAWLSSHDVALFKHPWRTCAYDEIDECVKRNKITAEQGTKARAHLQLAGFPRHFGLWACGMIARRSHLNALQNFCAPLWWKFVQELPRDQIWLPFVLWTLQHSVKRINTLDADIYSNKWLSFRRHGS